MADLLNPIFTDPEAAREHLEALRWEKGRVCPHCGECENTSPTASKNHKPGMYYCNSCEKTFTVTVGTLFERSHVPLNKWLLSFHLMASSKKGISAHQLHRTLGVTYKTAWFMAHRIREAMRPSDLAPFGEGGGGVEVDETFIGKQAGKVVRRGGDHKNKVLSLVDRNSGRSHSMVVDSLHSKHILPILQVCQRLLRGPRNRKPLGRRVRPPLRPHGSYEHHRGFLLDLQARHEGCLSALRQATPSPLSSRIRFSL